MKKRKLTTKEREKFLAIKNRLWIINKEDKELRQELDSMGLKFDVFGTPVNFTY